MKNQYFLLFLFIASSFSMFAQTQLSFIDNPVPFTKLKSNGIVTVNGDDYLIENDLFTLRVSTLKNDSIQLVYKISDFPFDQNINTTQGKLNNRSGFLVEGVYLYEILYRQIRKRNILTSEIIDVYHFPEGVNIFLKDAKVIGDIIHLRKSGDNEFMTLNTSTHEFTTLLFLKENTYRIGNIYYTPKPGGGIEEYNAIDQTIKENFENESNRYFGFNSTLMNQRGLIFGGFQQTRFISNDTTFILDCKFDSPSVKEVNIHETEEYFIAFYNDLNKTTIQVIDKLDCSVHSSKVVDFNTNGQNVIIYDSPILYNDYLLFKIEDNSDHPDSIYLFDSGDLSITTIPIENLRTIYRHSLYRSGEELYFIGEDKTSFLPIDKLYSINLKTKEFKTKLDGYDYDEPICFSSSETDSCFLIVDRYFEEGPLNLLKFYTESNFKEVKNSGLTQNAGLTPIRHLAVHEDKLIFEFKNGIYIADNKSVSDNKTTKISEVDNISKLAIEDNEMKGLMNNNDTSFYFTYNFSTEEIDIEPLTEYIQLEGNSYAISNYIFGDFSLSNKIYFDLETESITPIQISGEIDTMYRSHNSILFVSICDNRYCLTLFKDGNYAILETSYFEEPKIFSKKNGAFMIMEVISENQNRISIINKDGALGNQINVTGTILETNQEGIENGPLSALMFYDITTEDLEIIMHRDNNIQSFTVPYVYALWDNVIWYKAENSLIIKSADGYEPGLYLLTLDKEIKRLNLEDPSFSSYDLLFAASTNGVFTFVTSSYLKGVEIIEYNIETENLTRKDVDFTDFLYSSNALNLIYRISPFSYYVTFARHLGNSELHLFDSENLTLQPLPDLNLINQPSNPHHFIESLTHLYFIARSPDDNSYQLFSNQKEEITSVNNPNKYNSQFKVHPNPSSNFISIEMDADKLKIYNLQGIEIKTINGYLADQRIDISDLRNGIYFIETLMNNEKTINNFIKI